MKAYNANSYKEFLEDKSAERAINVFNKLSMRFIQTVLSNAESGNLGDYYELCEYIEAADTRLKGMINNRRKAVSKKKWHIASGNMDNTQANEAAELISQNIKDLKWKSFIRDVMDGRIYGIQINQKIWFKNEDGLLCLKGLRSVDKSKYEQANYAEGGFASKYKFGEILISKYQYGTETISAAELMEKQAIVMAIDKDDKGKYDLHGVMRGVLRWYIVKLFAIQSWSQFAEKYGFPVTTASMPQELYEANKALVERVLGSIGPNRTGVFIEGMEVDVKNPMTVSNIDVFDRLISLANNEIAIGLLGQNLSTDVSGGSFAAAKVHLEVLDSLVEDDAEWIDEIINDQIIAPIMKVNYPDMSSRDYPVYTTVFEKPVDIANVARGFSEASRIIPIPTKYIYEKLDIPEPQADEPTIGGFDDASELDQALNLGN